jgi:hypothetical protein
MPFGLEQQGDQQVPRTLVVVGVEAQQVPQTLDRPCDVSQVP